MPAFFGERPESSSVKVADRRGKILVERGERGEQLVRATLWRGDHGVVALSLDRDGKKLPARLAHLAVVVPPQRTDEDGLPVEPCRGLEIHVIPVPRGEPDGVADVLLDRRVRRAHRIDAEDVVLVVEHEEALAEAAFGQRHRARGLAHALVDLDAFDPHAGGVSLGCGKNDRRGGDDATQGGTPWVLRKEVRV